MGFLAPARAVVLRAMAHAMEPPPPPNIARWAARNVVFDDRSPIPGPFDPARFPFLAEIHACLGPEHPAREVTVRGSAQWGKTVSIINPTVGQWLDYGPVDVLVVHPTTSSAAEWVRNKWMPLRRSAPALRRLFGGAGSVVDSLSNQESRCQTRTLKVASAGSPSDLSGTSRRLVLLDDLAKFEMTAEGDPEAMAESRASAFEDAKIVRVSTPMVQGVCRISRSYERSDRRLYHVPCPHCGHEAPLTWENLRRSIVPEALADAHFTCEACGAAIEHRHKTAMVAAGRWVATNPAGDHPGFHLWRAYSPLRDWHSIAIDYARMRGWSQAAVSGETAHALTDQVDAATEQTFWNDVLGLPYEQATSAPKWQHLRDRSDDPGAEAGYELGRIPEAGVILTAGVDCQEDRIEVHVKAFGRNVRSHTVGYRVIPYKIDSEEGRAALDALMRETWPLPAGRRMDLDMLAIDEGNWQSDVRDWAYRYPWSRVITVKGSRSAIGPVLQPMKAKRRLDGRPKRLNKASYYCNVSLLKGEFYGRLEVSDPLARGWCGFPRGIGDEFYRQITAEVREVYRTPSGATESRWRLVEPTRRNEGLDTEIYAEIAALRKGWRSLTHEQWDLLSDRQSQAPEDGQGNLFDRSVLAVPSAPTPASAGQPRPASPRTARRIARSSYMGEGA